jgi:hypothetical protein
MCFFQFSWFNFFCGVDKGRFEEDKYQVRAPRPERRTTDESRNISALSNFPC